MGLNIFYYLTQVDVSKYGRVIYSESVSLDFFTTLNHRIFIMDNGLMCVKVRQSSVSTSYFISSKVKTNIPVTYKLSSLSSRLLNLSQDQLLVIS